MTAHYGLFGGVPTTDDPVRLAALRGYGRGLSKPPITGAPDLWGVGRAELRDRTLDVPFSWADVEKDTAWASARLDELGVGAGHFCIYNYYYRQSAQFWPFLKAGFDRGARVATGNPASWDAARMEMYQRRFTPQITFGISPQTVDGLENLGFDAAKVYASSRTLIALPGAWERLRAKGLQPWRLMWLGPILALEPAERSGARFDHGQWTLEAPDGEILVTSHSRAANFSRLGTGVAGRIATVDGEPRAFVEV